MDFVLVSTHQILQPKKIFFDVENAKENDKMDECTERDKRRHVATAGAWSCTK